MLKWVGLLNDHGRENEEQVGGKRFFCDFLGKSISAWMAILLVCGELQYYSR